MLAAVYGAGRVSHFAEGHVINPERAALIPDGSIGRMLSPIQARQLEDLLEERRSTTDADARPAARTAGRADRRGWHGIRQFARHLPIAGVPLHRVSVARAQCRRGHDSRGPIRPAAVLQDIATLAGHRIRAVPRAWRNKMGRLALPTLPMVIVAQLASIGAVIAWRGDIVRALPQTASLFRAIGLTVNLRGLVFSDLRSSKDFHDGASVLILDGTIQNVAGTVVSVPRLRFAVRNASGIELLSWTAPPDHDTLGHGETLPFRSRLASPPADGNDVSVRFLNSQDFMNGAH
jgi:hypothetical protein